MRNIFESIILVRALLNMIIILIIVLGALLKGPFSRFDYQRNPNSGQSAVKSYTTLLPAAAQDVYYRDEIGNISTSHLRNSEDYTELIIRPRYVLL